MPSSCPTTEISGAGTQVNGGAGGCTFRGAGCEGGCSTIIACGAAGSLGTGGDGASIGDGAATREGTGGAGFYGGGGGAATTNLSVGGGGSSLVPPHGVLGLATQADAASVVISTSVPKYLALEIPVYICFDLGGVAGGTHILDVSYLDKGSGDRHIEMRGLGRREEGASRANRSWRSRRGAVEPRRPPI